jgi:heme/copper-type cytochrome/quinol oxidase subunit 2
MELACFSQKPPTFWKYSHKTWTIFCFLYQVLVVLVTVYIILCEFLFVYRNYHEIYEVTACVAPLIAHVLNLAKLYTLWYQNDRIHAVIDELRQMVHDGL